MPTAAETEKFIWANRLDRDLQESWVRWERRLQNHNAKIARKATIENVSLLVRSRDRLREAQKQLGAARRVNDVHEIAWGEQNLLTALTLLWEAQIISGYNDADSR